MKKALSITLAGMLFTIEEDAYESLSSYLKSVQNYFGTYPESAEILKDIEARMAEQLMAMHENRSPIITITSVEQLIAVMGRVEDFDIVDGKKPHEHAESSHDAHHNGAHNGHAHGHGTNSHAHAGGSAGTGSSSNANNAQQNEARGPKRFMRNPDDVVIAGVASGMAAYFDIDTLLVRILFIVLSILMGGIGGIIIYLILALVIPMAKTPAEKTMMRGGPVSLQSFKENIQEMAKNMKNSGSEIVGKDSGLRNFLNKLLKVCGKIIQGFIKIFARIAGFLITIFAAIGMAFLTFGLISLMFKTSYIYPDFSVLDIVPKAAYYTILILLYMIAFIPLVLIGSLGQKLFHPRRSHIRTSALVVLITVWFFALPIAGAMISNYYPQIKSRVESLPQSSEISRTLDISTLSDFNRIDMHGSGKITLVQATSSASTSTSIVVTGRQADLDRTNFYVQRNTFSYSNKETGFCLFCMDRGSMDFVITVPDIEKIELSGAVDLESNGLQGQTLEVDISGISEAKIENARYESMDIYQSGHSDITVSGTVDTFNLDTSGISKFAGFNLRATKATIDASGAIRADIQVADTLDVEASGLSEVRYMGKPKLTIDTSGDSHVVERE